MNAPFKTVSLDDKYRQGAGQVYLTGIQALVRLPLDQIRADRTAGLNTAGYISGYRGSPLAGYDQQLAAARSFLDEHGVVFQPGTNEDMAATAIWGTQKVGLHPGARVQGVFGIWYGKAPGADRCGDVFRHANMSGTAPLGGVLAVAGDDYLAKSSSLPSHSELAFADWEIPVLCPSDLQEVLDYGLIGIALSRFAGVWAALIAISETMNSSGIISVGPERLKIRTPRGDPDPRAAQDLNRLPLLQIRLDTEVLMREVKLPAVRAFARANRLDRVRFGAPRPRFGVAASGKAYSDLMQILELLGIDGAAAAQIGLGVYKVAMPWPLEPQGLAEFAQPLERLLVVENKRGVIEAQIKEQAYHWPAGRRPQIWGKLTPEGGRLLPETGELGPGELARALIDFLPDKLLGEGAVRAGARIAARELRARELKPITVRSPFFCSGCPHNTGTRVPDGARAFSGIGCHVMTDLTGRTTDGSAQMGGEGVAWLGQFPFTNEKHVFVNLGDGTYYHSGQLAIRAALAAKAPVTFKILYNDAVAMTGGQAVEGPFSVSHLARQLAAEGIGKIALVSEDPARHEGTLLPDGLDPRPRGELMAVQKEFAEYPGVSVIIYDQTCAAEKRRRRRKGAYPDPDLRVFINERVCEGCGDCSQQSNCISVEPLATEFGLKRQINQSSCNKDFSCVKGFCPSFVEVRGGQLRRGAGEIGIEARIAGLKAPAPKFTSVPQNVLIAGIGGTGVTTAAAIIAMAAHLEGLDVLTLDVTGLAQKGGPVTSQIRLAPMGATLRGPEVPKGMLDVLLAADAVVASDPSVLALASRRRTRSAINSAVAPTSDFALHQKQAFDPADLAGAVKGSSRESWIEDFSALSRRLFGDTLYTNMLLTGFAAQKGLLPLSVAAIKRAIGLNGVAVKTNLAAFSAGRLLAGGVPAFAPGAPAPDPKSVPLDERIGFLAKELLAYQDDAYAAAFTRFAGKVRDGDQMIAGRGLALTRMVAEGLFRLMAYKDEYEVARLYGAPEFRARLQQAFEGAPKLSVQLAPPLFSRVDPASGRPRKHSFGPWIFTAFGLLAKLKVLRGTLFDPFGYSGERREERALIGEYRALIDEVLAGLNAANYDMALRIASSVDGIAGFGPVKAANLARARRERQELLAQWRREAGARPSRPHLEAAQ